MKRFTIFSIPAVLFLYLLLTAGCAQKPDIYEDYSWIDCIREDHPRLFFNNDSFEEVKKRALNEENQIFLEMKGPGQD